MTKTPPKIYGTAVFGTSDGLQSQGNGILCQKYLKPDLLEFRAGRERLGALHVDSPPKPALFRRPVIDRDGRRYELIGIISGCMDRHNRLGFFGSCLAIDHGSLDHPHEIPDWSTVIETADYIYKKAAEYIGENWQFYMPRSGELIQRNSDVDVGLSLVSSSELSVCEANSDGIIEPMNRLALSSAYADITMIGFQGEVVDCVSLGSDEIQAHLREVDAAIRHSIKSFRSDQIGKSSEKTSLQSADVRAKEVKASDDHALLRRIIELEQKVAIIESRRNSSSGSGNGSLGKSESPLGFGFPDRGPFDRSLFGSWFFSYWPFAVAVVLVFLAFVVWYFFRYFSIAAIF